MKRIIFLMSIILSLIVSNAQERLEYTKGGNNGIILLDGHDYYVHMDHNTFVGLSGKCRNLTLELDGKSGINFRGLQITGELIVESINGESHVVEEDVAHNYPNDIIYQQNNITVRHFDNPNSSLKLGHYAFKTAYLGSPTLFGIKDFEINHLNEDSTTSLIWIRADICANCESVNGGGTIDLVVSDAAVGNILGQTKVTFLRTKKNYKPDLSHLGHPDCGSCINFK